jgi:hypothetical protein
MAIAIIRLRRMLFANRFPRSAEVKKQKHKSQSEQGKKNYFSKRKKPPPPQETCNSRRENFANRENKLQPIK